MQWRTLLMLQVVPELQSNPSSQAILKADGLKFVTIFRSQLPKASLLTIFPQLVALLKSESNVVHSYAAILIERLLASKVTADRTISAIRGHERLGLSAGKQQEMSTGIGHAPDPIESLLQENNQPRFAAQDLTPFLQSLLENLFGVFALPDSTENEYAMKCVMRVISFVGPQVSSMSAETAKSGCACH